MGESFGEALRKARESAGLEIRQLAETTRIQGRYLEALEAENWGALPTGVIGRGFVRSLARELGVPADALLQRYQASRGREDLEPDRQLPESDWKVDLHRGRRVGPLLVALLALAVAGLALWLWQPWRRPVEPRPPIETGTVGPTAPTELLRPPADTPVAAPSAENVEAPTPPAAPTGSDAGQPSEPIRELRLEIRAVDRVWVRAIADGGAPQTRELKPGETLSAAATQGIEVRLGNAGAARISWNGEELRPAGKVGQVVTLRFPKDAEALKR